jgi:hypothetical protein
MRVLINLCDPDATKEENEIMYDNPPLVEWNAPVLPRIHETVDSDTIISQITKDMPAYPYICGGGQTWEVTWVCWRLVSGEVVPELHLVCT